MVVLKNYTVLFLMLAVASIGAGMALKNVVLYSMIFAAGLNVVFLLCGAYALGKRNEKQES